MSDRADPNILDIDALVEDAKRLGCDTPERVIERLKRIIVREQKYVDRREKQSWGRAHNELVAEDCACFAMAIRFIESKAIPSKGEEDDV